ncbi:hypothetical protein COCSUDRAFT_49196 [Coccomyxa subellipsoidea C-169]|uniref:P-loop containing nucleoside triphosphate hydrolase protein n=1 Tax=Coccomyxa subellipsoidea (strain C-169) TaxID=574566 RepID=I0YK49_COCSC|nr:hypothetical protein COCSUDRAFT_49196 [Coccomyxa subellipsoidea C-169]EIE18768.1 hypothetical protein COCSUDRAFT_49196 [Coccomyxa subellipsoidea C-169]|eukprot:XP_005643312.1 hypothetical protein COCSUDRAFT_49196 [Coccomyxa subellipsoidea C-169]
MGRGQYTGSPPGMGPPSAGRGAMQQYTSSPQTPQYTRGSQPAARTPQVGPLQAPCVAWVALSQTRNLFRVCEALSMCITGLCFQRLDSQHFAVSFPFDRDVIENLKDVFNFRDREWHPESRTWRFHMDKYQDVQSWALEHYAADEITLLEQISPDREIPQPHLETDYFVQSHTSQYIPRETWERLYEFQREGVRFALKHGGRALIADDMGLGKTVQAICVAACFHADWPLLVVCPSSMMLTWLELLSDWLPPDLLPDPANLVVITSSKDVDKKLDLAHGPPTTRHIVIASYDCAQKLRGYERHFGMVICDESHALKSPGSKRTQFFEHLTAAGGPIDMLRPGLMGSYDEFGERYCGAKVQVAPGKMDWRGAQNLEELNGILREHVLIRRLKKDVLHELPQMTRSRRTIPPDPDLLPMIEAVKKEMAQLDLMAGRLSEQEYDSQKRVLLMQLYRATGPAKVKAACELIESALNQGRKLLVFAHHKGVLDALEAAVLRMRIGEDGRSHQVGHMRIDGRSTAQARGDAVNAFQNDPHCRVALLSIRAAGAGITLHAASTVLFVELAWTPSELTQAEARAHRLGQEKEVDVLYLLAPGSVDDIIWSMVNSKLRVVGNALDGHLAGTATGTLLLITYTILCFAYHGHALRKFRLASIVQCLRITDARRFVGWAAGAEVAAAPSDDEDDAKAGLSQPSQPQLTTPPALRDTRPEPSGSGTRRQRSASPGADGGGRAGPRRRRLDFGQGSTSLQADGQEPLLSQASNSIAGSVAGGGTIATQQTSRDPFFSDSDSVWIPSARVASSQGVVPAAATQRTRSQPSQPGVGPSSQRSGGGGGGLGVFADDHDDELDAVLASPEMDALLSQRLSQQQPSQPARSGQDTRTPGAGRRRGGCVEAAEQPPTQPYASVQPQYSPYGQPPQRNGPPASAAVATGGDGGTMRQRGQASAWDYPTQPAAEIVDLCGEDCIEIE